MEFLVAGSIWGTLTKKKKDGIMKEENKLHWAIKIRLLLLIPGTWKWNGWIRWMTAWLELKFPKR